MPDEKPLVNNEPVLPPAPPAFPVTEEKKEEPKPAVVLENMNDYDPVTLMPLTLGHKLRMAKIMVASKLMPNGLDTPEKVCVALQMGHELGISPMMAIQNVAVISNKPSISTDLLVALIRKHPSYAGMSISEAQDSCTVTFKRKIGDFIEEYTNTFTMKDAQTAGLLNKDNWKKFPKRMLKHRATAFSGRDGFSDVFLGVRTTEEVESFAEETPAQSSMSETMFKSILSVIEKNTDIREKHRIAKEQIDENKVLSDEQKSALEKYLILEQV